MKSYPQLTLDYILYEMSYLNVVMYSSIIPSYDSSSDKQTEPKKGLSSSEFFSQMKSLKNGRT